MTLINIASHERIDMIQGAVRYMKRKQAQEEERKKVKLLFFDVETTGLLYYKHAIHQLSGEIMIDDEVVESFDYRMRPHKGAEIDTVALKKGRVSEQQINSYTNAVNAYRDFVEMISKYVDKFDSKDKFHLAGYNNTGFDNNFLRELFKMQGDQYFGSWFWNDSIDVMVMACNKLLTRRSEMAHFDLYTVAMEVGIEVEEKRLHEAAYDATLARRIYEIIR